MSRPQRQQRALIIGCGIGGPVAAMALQRAGITAEIFEAHPGPARFVGSFLNLASNGIDALRAIDADGPVLETSFPTSRMVMWNGAGVQLGDVVNGLALSDGTTSQTIERGRLHQALRMQAIERGIAIHTGKRLRTAAGTAMGVNAWFDDGTEAQGDLLVGADGLHSRARVLVDPATPSPRDRGLLSIGGYAHATHLTPTPDAFHMIFGRRVFFGYTVRPGGDVWWFANLSRDDAPANQAVGLKDTLLALLARDAGPWPDILEATGGRIAAYSIADLPRVPQWHTDRMVLIGDSAHAVSPSSGQGASLAIEDAVVLALCLRDSIGGDRALRRYQQLRQSRVERVIRYAARIDHSKAPGPIGRWLRDRLMPYALKHFASPESQAWLFRHHIDWNGRTMPEEECDSRG